ncbi:hypothetical protein G6F56_010726 [Rhizopus delemar]|nr:hypothetical protein G6F56_010726 [Rhizopus delemar]
MQIRFLLSAICLAYVTAMPIGKRGGAPPPCPAPPPPCPPGQTCPQPSWLDPHLECTLPAPPGIPGAPGIIMPPPPILPPVPASPINPATLAAPELPVSAEDAGGLTAPVLTMAATNPTLADPSLLLASASGLATPATTLPDTTALTQGATQSLDLTQVGDMTSGLDLAGVTQGIRVPGAD